MHEPRPTLTLEGEPGLYRLIRGLAGVTFAMGDRGKGFVRDLAEQLARGFEPQLTARQARWVERLAWRYRRQLPAQMRPLFEPPPFSALTPPPEGLPTPTAPDLFAPRARADLDD